MLTNVIPISGYGRFLTDSKGNYYFRTIKPVPYPGRTPHIHIAVSLNGHRVFTSQILIKGSLLISVTEFGVILRMIKHAIA